MSGVESEKKNPEAGTRGETRGSIESVALTLVSTICLLFCFVFFHRSGFVFLLLQKYIFQDNFILLHRLKSSEECCHVSLPRHQRKRLVHCSA